MPTWTDQLAAWSALASAVFAALTFVVALVAGYVALETMRASQAASRAAKDAADEARLANEQARLDSVEQTRPYVYVEVVPSLFGAGCWDIRISNVGKSCARDLTLETEWPAKPDDVAQSVRELFGTPRSLPPGSSVRAAWRLEGDFGKDGTEAGMPAANQRITAHYTSDDPSRPRYAETSDAMFMQSGLWPIPRAGPEPSGLHDDLRKFYLLGQELVRSIGEMRR